MLPYTYVKYLMCGKASRKEKEPGGQSWPRRVALEQKDLRGKGVSAVLFGEEC